MFSDQLKKKKTKSFYIHQQLQSCMWLSLRLRNDKLSLLDFMRKDVQRSYEHSIICCVVTSRSLLSRLCKFKCCPTLYRLFQSLNKTIQESFLPWQERSSVSSLKPFLQLHSKLPMVFLQKCSQPPFWSSHSSISAGDRRYPYSTLIYFAKSSFLLYV